MVLFILVLLAVSRASLEVYKEGDIQLSDEGKCPSYACSDALENMVYCIKRDFIETNFIHLK